MKDTIVVDLDGCVYNVDHRLHLAQAKNWDAFNAACVDDTPNPDVLAVVQVLLSFHSFHVIFVTGRSEEHRQATIAKLREDHIFADCVLMRPTGDYTPIVELKIQLLEEYFGGKEQTLERVLFALDDKDRIVEAFRNYGFPAWQVKQGAY
jgi:hypothetical protein